jgi:hypothetical protein
MDGYVVMGVFGLHLVDSAVHQTALNEKLTGFDFEVFPPQCRDLAHAKSQALCDQNHRSIRLLQPGYDGFEAFDSQNHGPFAPLGRIPDPHHLDRIAAVVD